MWKKVSASALALSLMVSGFTSVEQASAANNGEVTRGEYVKALIETMNVELGTGKSVAFKDVPDSLKPYIEKAIELKLITGKSATTFAPDEKISREHAFVIAARAIQVNKMYSEAALTKYKDYKNISKGNRQNIAKALELGFLKGTPDKKLKLNNILTESQMNSILQRFLKSYSPVKENTTVSLRILGTSDIHTNLVNYDYYKDVESNSVGIAKTATLIKEARQENPNTLLFDNGDTIQGTPLGSYKQSVDKLETDEQHPSIKVMELLDYDAAT